MAGEKIKIDVLTNGINARVWVRSISEVDLAQPGGFALGKSPFLTTLEIGPPGGVASPDHFVYETDISSVEAGTPIVVGVTFAEPSSPFSITTYSKTPGDFVDIDKVAFLVVAKSGRSSAQYSAEGRVVEVSGDIFIHDFHGQKDRRTKVEGMDGSKTSNPYYWAAHTAFNDKTLEKKFVKQVRQTDEPIAIYGRKTITLDSHKYRLPEGYEFALELSTTGIWLVACAIPGKKKMALGDILLEASGREEDVAIFLEDQARRLEGMAMTYRIIAQAKRGAI